jgi:hypothetical protein
MRPPSVNRTGLEATSSSSTVKISAETNGELSARRHRLHKTANRIMSQLQFDKISLRLPLFVDHGTPHETILLMEAIVSEGE